MAALSRRIVFATILVALPLVGCATSGRGEPRLEITADVEERNDGAGIHPVAVVTLTNMGRESVALSRTHCACGLWLALEIEDAGGRRVSYPREAPELTIVSLPRYECVAPAQKIAWTIDLRDFRLEFGGEPRSKPLSFHLAPGDYRLRARYKDDRRPHIRCGSSPVETASKWTRFTVR